MKTVKIASSARGIRRLLARARASNLILRAPDGREFILAEIDDFNREIELTRQNKALMKLLVSRSKTKKRVPLAEVRKRLSITKQSAA
jgi:hypothetical protein